MGAAVARALCLLIGCAGNGWREEGRRGVADRRATAVAHSYCTHSIAITRQRVASTQYM